MGYEDLRIPRSENNDKMNFVDPIRRETYPGYHTISQDFDRKFGRSRLVGEP
jgi:hypothetical protein